MASTSSKRPVGRPRKKTAAKKRVTGVVGSHILNGHEYVTTHSCHGCDAAQVTTGTAFPMLVCCRCRMPMKATSTLMELQDDR